MVAKNTGFSSLGLKYKQYQDIKKHRANALNKALEHEQNQDYDSFETQFHRAQKLDSFLAGHPWRKIRDAIYAGVIAAVCVGLIWALSVIKISINPLTLMVDSESVQIEMPDNSEWQWKGNLPITDIYIDNLVLDHELEQIASTNTDSVHLKSLHTGGGGSVGIGFDYDRKIDFRRNMGSLQGNFEFSLTDKKYRFQGNFFFKDKPAVTGRLRFKAEDQWRLGKIDVDAISFYQEFPSGLLTSERATESTVLKGFIRLKDIERTTELHAEDGLKLEGCTGQLSITVIPETQRVVTRFDGKARKIIWEERNLAPSLLAWGYHGQSPAFFSAAFLALWGLLWRVRKWIF
jgi:hypothetical protein